MKRKVAFETLLLLPLWLLLQNFNVPDPGTPPPDSSGRPAVIGGKSSYKIKKVVLDAGHGGHDPGCIGAVSQEKNNTLAIVLEVGTMIKQQFPDVEVIYTRDKDVFVELNERAAIANRNNADLFISVHCNAVSSRKELVYGAETYVMGLHTAEHNLEVAKRENASIFLEANYEKNYAGYDPNSPEAHIFGSVWQGAYLEQSILFASYVQKNIVKFTGRADKGVKQAGFIVLREAAMPAVLIETGFLTNRAEEAYLVSEDGRKAMAAAIMDAFKTYKMQMEGSSVAKAPETTPKAQPVKAVAVVTEKGPSAPKAQPVAVAHTPEQYRIFLLSGPARMDTRSGQLSLLSNVSEEKNGSEYHYFIGTFAARTEAEKALAEVRNLGFRTARIESGR